MAVDWAFIGTLEGQSVLIGYVPDAAGSNSGVTIATGVDLGQLSAAALDAFAIPAGLKAKLRPYLGRHGVAAQDYLSAHPLGISRAEAEALDPAVREPILDRLCASYEAAAGVAFDTLPDAAQTAIASVAFQYGADLKRRAPKFWAAATAQDWPRAIGELRNFGDRYATRRRKEADYLANGVGLG